MPVFQHVTLRRSSLVLIVAFAIAVAAVAAAAASWELKPERTFNPLSIPDTITLIDGQGSPPRIVSGAELKFNPATWCNSLGHPAKVVVAITMINLDQPPQSTVPVISGLPATVAPGCTGNHALNLQLPDPLPPGAWRLALTVVVTDAGRSQSLSVLSQPFVVTAA